MPSEMIREYEIEYSGEPLAEGEGWEAYVAVYGPCSNPTHRNSVFPHQRVVVETVFPNVHAAEKEAHRIALSMLQQVKPPFQR